MKHAHAANAKLLDAKRFRAVATAERAWKQFEDHLVPRLHLSLIDRAVYSHLLRHSRLEGKRQLRFSIRELARRIRISAEPVRDSIQRLSAHGVLRALARSNAGYVVEVRLPGQVSVVRDAGRKPMPAPIRPHFRMEQTNFMKTRALRHSIHRRERGFCFYCMKQFKSAVLCLDHVIPVIRSGRNSYRNLVSCCVRCNSRKGVRSASDFLCRLYRERCLTAAQLRGRLRALEALAAGRLKPHLPHDESAGNRSGHPMKNLRELG